MLAYLVAQYLTLTCTILEALTNGKHLWLRNNGSTAVSQLVDTIVVNGIFRISLSVCVLDQIVPIVCVYIVKLFWLG